MKIAVCVKQVPDSWAEKKMGSDGRLDRESADAVLNDLDEYAVEEALKLVEAHSPTNEVGEGSGHSITIISMGPERASEACLLYTSPSPRDRQKSRMPSSA